MTPRYIIIHHTAHTTDVPISDIRRWHVDNNGWRDVGYHYYIRKNGEIEVGRMEHERGAHARGMNDKSIGIAISGHFTSQEEPNRQQIESAKRLVASLCRRYEIVEVLGHRDVGATACPGFDQSVLNEIAGNTGESAGI